MPDLIVIAATLGGIGLFLLGMMLMTEGLLDEFGVSLDEPDSES